ncbi:equilibrative nucleobase transporter 1-like [Ylistrum balloti]|uniref:equilibrative nucleobase transporter 1-like n=1 Tax=Ylistrum balloti TaxID=509963 RepID=UPI0029058E3D|nr:equilibrative nucleobase transporter 1-like [Ylistrum balloti]
MKYNGWRKYLVALWATIETFLFAGLLYGWAPLVWIFKQEDVYANLCQMSSNISVSYNNVSASEQSTYNVMTMRSSSVPTTEAGVEQDFTCQQQDDKFALVFTIGSAIFCASSAACGIIVYKTGTRVTRIISMTFFICGTMMLAFVDKETPWLVFPGLTIMGVGGLPLLMTNAQISNLFVSGRSTFIGLLVGAYDASAAVLLIFKFAYEEGLQSQYSFVILAALHMIVPISTFVFLPKDRISNSEKPVKEEGTMETFIPEKINGKEGDSPVHVHTNTPLKSNSEDKPERRHPSLKSCVLSDTFILHVFWVCILQLRFYYFLGSLNSYLHRITDNNKLLVSEFTNTMMYTMVGGAVFSPFAGVVYDWQRKIFRKKQSDLQSKLMPAVLPMSVASGLGFLLSVLALLPSLNILYVDFIVMTFLRSFLYSTATTFLTVVFPSEYFEMLYGLMIISAGIFGCLQFALFTWSMSYLGAVLHSDVFCICLTAVSLIHPIYLWVKCRREANFSMEKH